MKKLVKCVPIFIALVMVFCSFTYAAEEKDVISIDEYENTLKAKYAKYGVDFEVLDYDENVKLTRDLLNKELEKVNDVINSFKIVGLTVNVEGPATDRINPMSMFYDNDVIVDWLIVGGHGYANMRSEANVTINGSNDDVVSINSYETYQHGSYVNFDSWETTSMSVERSSTDSEIDIEVEGRIRFSYTEPTTGIEVGETLNVSETFEGVDAS